MHETFILRIFMHETFRTAKARLSWMPSRWPAEARGWLQLKWPCDYQSLGEHATNITILQVNVTFVTCYERFQFATNDILMRENNISLHMNEISAPEILMDENSMHDIFSGRNFHFHAWKFNFHAWNFHTMNFHARNFSYGKSQVVVSWMPSRWPAEARGWLQLKWPCDYQSLGEHATNNNIASKCYICYLLRKFPCIKLHFNAWKYYFPAYINGHSALNILMDENSMHEIFSGQHFHFHAWKYHFHAWKLNFHAWNFHTMNFHARNFSHGKSQVVVSWMPSRWPAEARGWLQLKWPCDYQSLGEHATNNNIAS